MNRKSSVFVNIKNILKPILFETVLVETVQILLNRRFPCFREADL